MIDLNLDLLWVEMSAGKYHKIMTASLESFDKINLIRKLTRIWKKFCGRLK